MIYNNMQIHNAQSMKELENGIKQFCRVPEETRIGLNEHAQSRAFNGTGMELRFNITGEALTLKFKGNNIQLPYPTPDGIMEIYHGCFQSDGTHSPVITRDCIFEVKVTAPTHIHTLKEIARKEKHVFDPELVRILLPYDRRTGLISVEGECTPPRAEQVPEKRYLAYGSSITHGSCALGTSMTYARLVADKLGVDLINLGFPSSAHMEDAMAEHIASRDDWDFATLEMGINVLGKWTAEEFENRIDVFVDNIATRKLDKWIFCIDLFPCHEDYTSNEKIEKFREIVKRKVEKAKLPKLIHLPGKELLKTSTGLTADLLHPSAAGMMEIAENLSNRIKKHMV